MKVSFLKNIQLYPTEHFNLTINNLTRRTLETCIDGNSKVDIKLSESRYKHLQSDVQIANLEKLNVKFDEFH